MFKYCTVINKNTGEIFQGQVDTELEGIENYPYRQATAEEIAAHEAKKTAKIFEEAKNATIEYQGKPFKIKWCWDYSTIVLQYADELETKNIWYSETEYIALNKAELIELKNLLADEYETAYDAYREARKALVEGE